MKLTAQKLLLVGCSWSLLAASALELRSGDTIQRRDGAVSSRFSAESRTEADLEAREARLQRMELMERRIEARATELEMREEAMKTTGHELAPKETRKRFRPSSSAAPSAGNSSTFATFFMQQPFPGGWDGNNLPPPGTRVPPFEHQWWNPRFPYGRNNVLGFLTLILIGTFCWWLYTETHTDDKGDGDALRRTPKEAPQDTYGFAIVSLVRDLQQMARDEGDPSLRQARITSAVGLLFFTFVLQVFITLQIKIFVTAKCVHNIRNDYEAYQTHMYGDDPEAYTIGMKHPIFPVYAGRRGNPGYFMPGNFVTLDDGVKEGICNIPFSQPPFFLCVLLIWSLTCIMDVRLVITNFRSLILNTKTISNMKNALEDLDPDVPDDDPENRWVVDGLTMTVKVMITVLILIPRLILVVFLLWLGCRFLAATNDFGNMVLNAVALEFVLLIKDLLYTTVVPDRNKREIEKISVRPSSNVEFASYWTYLGTFSWGFVAIAWIYYYMFAIQMVLPQYRWDVAPVCTPWLWNKYGPYS